MDDETRTPATCSNCGRPLPPDAPEGLCAACLLAGATGTLTGSFADAPTIAGTSANSPSAEGPQLSAGDQWGPYRVGRLLGRGGMGEVYEAEHLESGRRLALKILRSRLQSRDERARFLREGQLAASVSHPHTVYIFGSEEVDGMPAITMELLPGGTLKDRVAAQGPLPIDAAVSAVLDIVSGLDAAQAVGILHRDIKPSNCFVDADGSIKVGDFGLSISTLARDVRSGMGGSDGFQGTPQFAAPEQLRGEPLDVRADIYAVGATLYYLLTGHAPFEAPDLQTLFARVTRESPRTPRGLRGEIPQGLAAIVLQCLEKTPARRPPSYAALAELLRPFAASTPIPAPAGIRMVAGVVDAVLIGTVGFMWGILTLDVDAPETHQRWAWLVGVAYYLALEPVWRASLGKRLFGLRVAAAGHPSASAAIVLRTLIFYIPNLIAMAIVAAGLPTGIETGGDLGNGFRWNTGDPESGATLGLTVLLTALLFVPARRGNGWRGLHDRMTGTGVVLREAAPFRRRIENPTLTPASPVSTGQRYGPFVVVSEVIESPAARVAPGFDQVLRRPVWIHVVPPGTPAVPSARRDVNRIGRLHWLAGRRAADENWDAYEAPDGAPLLRESTARAAAGEGAGAWGVLKVWLLDLVAELIAAQRDGTQPVLALDRLWIRQDGRVVLLDFPIVPTTSDASRAGLTPMALLRAVAAHVRSRAGESEPMLPLSARVLLDEWSSAPPPPLESAQAALQRAAAMPNAVSRARRAIPIGLAAAPIAMMLVVGVVVTPLLTSFFASETAVVMRWLDALNSPPGADSRLSDPTVRDAVERYVIGRYGARLRDPEFWNRRMTRQSLSEYRPYVDGMFARHAAVSPEELDAATSAIAPERERMSRANGDMGSDMRATTKAMTSLLVALTTGVFAVLVLLSALLVPGGIVTRLNGLAVVTRSGVEIGRLRSVTRAAVAWAPAIVWVVWLLARAETPEWSRDTQLPASTMFALTALFSGGVIALVHPSRGLHDRVVGTWVVPR